ncbi:MAG: hypothetical protein EHM70_07955 [Chloroflexota bacterium]|nr:MAG: hypothetical protein EHM70_07955 [Chloroflexota bacterium]
MRAILKPAEASLFFRLQPGEQAHSIDVLHNLIERGEAYPDLWVAALLHDVGKSCYPLNLWERVWIVLGKAIFPEKVNRWGSEYANMELSSGNKLRAPFWRRPFVVAVLHPEWGARLAETAGSSPMVVSLIRRHQDAGSRPGDVNSPTGSSPCLRDDGSQPSRENENQLLISLKAVDEES